MTVLLPLAAALLALAACGRRDAGDIAQPAPVTPPASVAAPARPPEPAIPPERRCGEAGAQPTELPPDLARGRAPAGTGTLGPGDKLTLGKANFHYDPSGWIGTRRAGHHGAALAIEIDRAEVGEHAPWGAHLELEPDREQHTFVGPYRFDLRTGPGDPPIDVRVTVSRELCPASAVIAATAEPRSLWLSTEAIRTHTYDLAGEFKQFSLDGRGDTPRLDISELGYRQWLEPRPDTVRRFRVGGHLVTLDRVTPGPNTGFDGAWKAEGDARLHVRVRIDPVVAAPEPAPVAATTTCGEAAARTDLPPALKDMPRIVADRHLDVGHDLELGPLSLKYGTLEIPAHGHGPYREEARQIPNLQVFGGALGGQSVADPRMGPRLVRLGHELLRIDPDGPADRVRVRRLATACPHGHAFPALQAPVYVWLSPLGHSYVTVPDRGTTPLSLQLHVDVSGPSLALGSAQAFLSAPLRPNTLGRAYTLDDHLVEIVDIVPGPDTLPDGQNWQSGGLLPVVHVQLKITPQPGGP